MNRPKIIMALYVPVGLIFLGLLGVGLWKLKAAVDSGFGSVNTCHSIENGVAPTVERLIDGRTLEGKLYRCGQVLGPFPDIENEIVYTIRGSYDSGKSTKTLGASLGEILANQGWQLENTKNGNGRQAFTHTLEQKGSGQLQAKLDVISPKYSLFNLRVRTSESYAPTSEDTSKLVDKVPAPDLQKKYVSFDLLSPTQAPDGYVWSPYESLAWREGQTPRPEQYLTTTINSYRLVGGDNRAQFYRLDQRLYEADNEVQVRGLADYDLIAAVSNGEVYKKLESSGSATYLLKRIDSIFILKWSGLNLPEEAERVEDDEALRVFSLLEPAR